jgi:hypothetical protein
MQRQQWNFVFMDCRLLERLSTEGLVRQFRSEEWRAAISGVVFIQSSLKSGISDEYVMEGHSQ